MGGLVVPIRITLWAEFSRPYSGKNSLITYKGRGDKGRDRGGGYIYQDIYQDIYQGTVDCIYQGTVD